MIQKELIVYISKYIAIIDDYLSLNRCCNIANADLKNFSDYLKKVLDYISDSDGITDKLLMTYCEIKLKKIICISSEETNKKFGRNVLRNKHSFIDYYYDQIDILYDIYYPEVTVYEQFLNIKLNFSFSGKKSYVSFSFGSIPFDYLKYLEKNIKLVGLLYLNDHEITNIITKSFTEKRSKILETEKYEKKSYENFSNISEVFNGLIDKFSIFILDLDLYEKELLDLLIRKNEEKKLKTITVFERENTKEEYFIPQKSTFPRFIGKKEEKLMDSPKEKLVNLLEENNSIKEFDEEFGNFFSQRALTVDDCLCYIEKRIPNSVKRKNKAFFISIPSADGKNSICSGVIVHPGHGGIEEHCVPYYIKEIKKALRNSGWIK